MEALDIKPTYVSVSDFNDFMSLVVQGWLRLCWPCVQLTLFIGHLSEAFWHGEDYLKYMIFIQILF